jgi:hypothetical protein
MGCLTQTIRQNQPSPCRPCFGLERTNPRRIDIVLPTPITCGERINYASPLRAWTGPRPAIAILFGTRLRRTGACTISLIALLVSYSVSQYDTCCRDSALAELEDTPRFEVSHMHGASQGCTCSFNCKSNKHIPM